MAANNIDFNSNPKDISFRPSGKPEENGNLEYTKNGKYTEYPRSGYAWNGVNIDINVEPELEELSVQPKPTPQNFTPGPGYDGFVSVSVDAMKLDEYTVDPFVGDKSEMIYASSKGLDGFNVLTVNPVNASIDSNIKSENIRSNVSILGIEGTYEGEEVDWDELYNTLEDAFIIGEKPIDPMDCWFYWTDGMGTEGTGGTLYSFRDNNGSSLQYNVPGPILKSDYPNGYQSVSFQNNTEVNYIQNFDVSGYYKISSGMGLSSTFKGCTNLKTVQISNPQYISGLVSTFQGCTSLLEVVLGDSITSLKINTGTLANTFYGCTSIRNITLGLGNLTGVSAAHFRDTFYNCTSLKNVRLWGLGNSLTKPVEIDLSYSWLITESGYNNLYNSLGTTSVPGSIIYIAPNITLSETLISNFASKGFTISYKS